LERKGFSQKWINWMMEATKGGRVCIDINGERGEFLLGVLRDSDKGRK
jgi:hypothetical protein